MTSQVKFLVFAFFLLFSASACTSTQAQKNPQELLLGEWVWVDLRHVIRFTAEGTWAMDDSGMLDTNPDVLGSYTLDGETLSMVIEEGSRFCEIGDRWVWNVSSIDEASLTGITVEDECAPQYEGDEVAIARCKPEKEITMLGCEPLDWEAFCELAPNRTECK